MAGKGSPKLAGSEVKDLRWLRLVAWDGASVGDDSGTVGLRVLYLALL